MLRRELLRSATTEGSGGPAPSPGPDAAPPAAPVSEPNTQELIADDIRSILNFDPFEEKPSATPQAPAQVDPPPSAQAAPPVSSTAPVPPGGPAPAAPTPPVTAPQPGPPSDLAAAAAELAAAAQDLRQVRAPQQQQPQTDDYAPQWIPPGSRDAQPLDYGQLVARFDPNLIDAMRSENPVEARQAIGHVLGSLAHVIHRNAVSHVVTQLRNEFGQVLPNFFDHQWEVRRGQEMVERDFYGKYPQLGSPAIRKIVQAEAMQMAGQWGGQGWNDGFRDALAQRVYQVLGAVMPAAQVAPTPAPSVPPAGMMSGTGSRPALPPAPSAQPWDDLF